MFESSLLLILLAWYSFLGWIAEVVYVLAKSHHLQNRGFLTGPFVPIYGVGAIALLLAVEPYVENPFLVFVAAVLVTSALEFVTHLVLDKLFHVRLWDYSSRRFNLRGRICLENSLLFGALGLLLLYVIHPVTADVVRNLPHDVAIAIASLLLGILLVDAANSIRSLAKVRVILDEAGGTLAQARERIEQASLHGLTLQRLVHAFPLARSTRG